MNAENLYRQLQKINEAKGYYFNRDKEKTMFLLESLLKNNERYRYMCRPCRLAQEDAKADRDIIFNNLLSMTSSGCLLQLRRHLVTGANGIFMKAVAEITAAEPGVSHPV
jgi:hypothetical protein